ncbi:reverse transcriptase domain-containing protein [Tanacetum coccineum]
MDDEPMWAADRVVALTLGSTITIPETANEFAIKGSSNSDIDKITARMDAMTMKIDALYKEFQSRSKQPILDHNDDDTPILADKQSGRPSGSLPSNTHPNPKGMPNYGKFLKELVSNKHKLEQISSAFLCDESSAMIQNKVPPNFSKAFSCNALADLGASINLIPNSLYAKLSLKTLKPTKMSVRLADRSFQHPIGIAKNMIVEVGSRILHSIEGTILKEKLFAEFDEFMAMTADENSESDFETEEPPFKKITFNTDYKIKTSFEEPPSDLELKPYPDNLEYVFLCMLAIFHDMIEESMEVFMDDFPVFGNSFDNCLKNINKILQHCKDANLVLNWEKCQFMVKEGIMLGHKVFGAGLEVDKAKIDVISKLPPPTNVKGIRSFLGHGHDGFLPMFLIKDFFKNYSSLTKLLERSSFGFNG